MQKPERDYSVASPEELQDWTKLTCLMIPVRQPVETFEEFTTNSNEAISAMGKRSIGRMMSEVKPLFLDRLRELTDQSKTTNIYRRVLQKLALKAFHRGRRNKPQREERALIDALQLETPTGIYTLGGASDGEAFLFDYVLNDFMRNLSIELIKGNNPEGPMKNEADDPKNSNFFESYTMTEMKEFFLKWEKEYASHYGKTVESKLLPNL